MPNFPAACKVQLDAIQAEAVVLQEDMDDLYGAYAHTTYLFPEDTDETMTFTAGALADAWTAAYTEIVDNNGITFSSKLAALSGHITVIVIETVSVNGQVYEIELTYGAAHTLISLLRLYSGAVPKQDTRIHSIIIPAGETVYYRAKCSQAGGQSCTGHLRYHFHNGG